MQLTSLFYEVSVNYWIIYWEFLREFNLFGSKISNYHAIYITSKLLIFQLNLCLTKWHNSNKSEKKGETEKFQKGNLKVKFSLLYFFEKVNQILLSWIKIVFNGSTFEMYVLKVTIIWKYPDKSSLLIIFNVSLIQLNISFTVHNITLWFSYQQNIRKNISYSFSLSLILLNFDVHLLCNEFAEWKKWLKIST